MRRLGTVETLVGMLIVLLASESHALCPVGSYPWADKWGNRVCKSFNTRQNRTTEGSLSNCPIGSHPWVDSWGNKICQSFDGAQRYYDTSKGCPIGTHPWVDGWGNNVCQPF